MQPSTYTPSSHDELIGPAGPHLGLVQEQAVQLNESGGPSRIILHGLPGVGKSRCADILAKALCNHPVYLESINGRNVTSDIIREWMRAVMFRPIGGHFSVKLINEIDTMTPSAKDIMNDYLDNLPKWTAIIGTTNHNLSDIKERFETRFQQFAVDAPTTEELSQWLRKKWKLHSNVANAIAVGSGGNIRAALLDTQSYLDVNTIPEAK